MSPRVSSPLARRNARVGLLAGLLAVGMVGAAFAAVPLYDAFCRATGFSGIVRRAEAAPTRVLERSVRVRFDTNVRQLPWSFTADRTTQDVRIGDTALAFFRVENTSDRPVTGRAVYNVTPHLAAAYFAKLECFCFQDQTLQPGQVIEFPVVFFVDPRFVDDPDIRDATEITLSYTFLPSADAERAERAASQALARGPSALGEARRAGL